MAAADSLKFGWLPLLLSSNQQVRAVTRRALDSLHNNDPAKAKSLAQSLLQVLKDPQRTGDQIAAIRGLGVLGKQANDAYKDLDHMMMNRNNPLRIRVAAMKALEKITLDGSIENRLREDVINANKERQGTSQFRTEFNQLERAIREEP